MAKYERIPFEELSPLERNDMFGFPPILSSENEEHYHQIWDQMTAHFKPVDVLELMLVRNVVDGTWELQRYIRQRTLSVERRFEKNLEFQEKRAKEIIERRDNEIQKLAEKMGVPANECAKKFQLDMELERILSDTVKVFDRIPTELEHAGIIETSIVYHQQLETLINGALRRRDSALLLLEHYRRGLGEVLRKKSDRIVEAASKTIEYQDSEIAAPNLAPDDSEAE